MTIIQIGKRRGGATTLTGPASATGGGVDCRPSPVAAGASPARAIGRVASARHVGHERGVELEKRVARRVEVGVGRPVRGVLHAIAHRLKLGERIRLIEVDELALARFANQRLPGEDGAADERAERGFHRDPRLDQVGGEVFGAATAVQPGHRGARRVELEARAPTVPGWSPNDPEEPRYGAAADEALRVVGRDANSRLTESVLRHSAHELFHGVRRIPALVTHAPHDLLPGPAELGPVLAR